MYRTLVTWNCVKNKSDRHFLSGQEVQPLPSGWSGSHGEVLRFPVRLIQRRSAPLLWLAWCSVYWLSRAPSCSWSLNGLGWKLERNQARYWGRDRGRTKRSHTSYVPRSFWIKHYRGAPMGLVSRGLLGNEGLKNSSSGLQLEWRRSPSNLLFQLFSFLDTFT